MTQPTKIIHFYIIKKNYYEENAHVYWLMHRIV